MSDSFVKYARRIRLISDESSFTWHKPLSLFSPNNCKTSRQMLGSTLLGRYERIEFS